MSSKSQLESQLEQLCDEHQRVIRAARRALDRIRTEPGSAMTEAIVMDLEVSKDSVSQITSGGVPAIDTRAIKTQVLVNNGETVVLGGIYEQSKVTGTDSTPGLSSIPIIGALFTRNTKTDNKSELLIFVTPKILKDSLKTGL